MHVVSSQQQCQHMLAGLMFIRVVCTGLQLLNLAGCNLQGQPPEGLADLAKLRQLNLSSNPALSGPLPDVWASMPLLEVLDVSSCSITGTLPAEFAALQSLRELHASNNKGLRGQLPSSWGLMQNLRVRGAHRESSANTLYQ
jgi:hypothetical protein